MLPNTFCHIPGVGAKTERRLWSDGITSWDALLHQSETAPTRSIKRHWPAFIRDSVEHHANRNLGFFYEHLPASDHWRLFHDFQDTCAFLDIETTGLSAYDQITTIALYDGQTVRHYVNGDNLEQFVEDVRAYRLLVTYNGKCFDVPFIERFFGIRLAQAHIDLRHTLRSLGIRGGLKACERQVGLHRPGMEEVDGFLAVLLWEEYRHRGNAKALETLLAYNIQDTLNLHFLMVHAHNAKVKETPFVASHTLPVPYLPAGPFQADRATVERLIRERYGSWSFSR